MPDKFLQMFSWQVQFVLSPFNCYRLLYSNSNKRCKKALFCQFLLTNQFYDPFKNQRFRNSCVKNQINKKKKKRKERKRLTPFGRSRLHLASDVRDDPHKREKRNVNESQAINCNFKSLLIVSSTTLITVSVFNLSQRRNVIEIPLHERLMKISRKAA